MRFLRMRGVPLNFETQEVLSLSCLWPQNEDTACVIRPGGSSDDHKKLDIAFAAANGSRSRARPRANQSVDFAYSLTKCQRSSWSACHVVSVPWGEQSAGPGDCERALTS